jgi:YYY domain-containing protein
VIADILRWWLAVEVVGLAVLPLAARLFPSWPDRGHGTARLLGLVLVGYTAWLSGMLGWTRFTGPTIVVLSLILGAAVWARADWREGLRGGSWSTWVAGEVLFLLVLFGGLAIRSLTPAIAGQEKQMDLTFLHALMRSETLPAEDGWLAGYGLPYYYFGYLVYALPGKTLALDPTACYNLALPPVVALAAAATFSVMTAALTSAGVTRRWAPVGGLLGAAALVLLGNLQALAEVAINRGLGSPALWADLGIKNLSAGPTGAWFPSDGAWWFRAARVIPNIRPDGITEFPYFSFLLGDLHPHYMALPLAVVVLGLALARLTRNDAAEPRARGLEIAGLEALLLGAVIPTNTWDVPLLWGAFAAAVLVTAFVGGVDGGRLRRAVLGLGATFGAAVLLFAPYFVGYVSQPLGLGLVGERTPPGSLWVLFGALLWLPLAAGLLILAAEGRGRRPWAFGAAAVSLVLAGGLAAMSELTLALLVAGLGVWLQVAWWRLTQGPEAGLLATPLLVALGLGALLVPEVVFIRDVFGSRMNTVFKLQYDAWIVLALAAPLIGWEVLRRRRPAEAWIGRALVGVAAALALGGLLYPLGATPSRIGLPQAPTLDGAVALRAVRPDDAAAADWVRRAQPGVGLVEAVGDDYSDAGRFASFGGSVAPLGWIGHEVQWRGPRPELDARRELVRRVYTAGLDEATVAELRSWGIELIAVGSLERQIFGPDVARRFDHLEAVHTTGATQILRLPRQSQ